MFLWLWTFLKGYVAVKVTGVHVERFLNMAAHKGVYIWDVSPMTGGIKMHCSVRGFRMLKNCAKKTKCRLKIVNREGLPFILHRYRKRKVLMGGTAFFVVFLYIMSSFIWRIDVEGNNRVTSEEILKFVNVRGLHIGAFRYFVDQNEIGRQILFQFPDVAWVNVYTRGTRTNITVSETIPEQPHIPRDEPCNIVASRDGLITGIVTAAGIPKVRQNDVVRQGDVLVSGIIPVELGHLGTIDTIFVHAYAEVWAKMYTPIQFAVPMSYTYKVFTGNERSHHSLQWLFGHPSWRNYINLFHGRILFDNYDKIVSYIQPGASGDYPLPFIWMHTLYREFIPETRHRTIDEAKALADRIITERIIREFDFQADVVGKQVQFTEQPEQLMVFAVITVNQRIDKAVPIEKPAEILPEAPVES